MLDDFVKAGKGCAGSAFNESAWGAMTFLRESEVKGLPRMQSIQNAYS